MRVTRWWSTAMCAAAMFLAAADGGLSMTNEELKRYGFGTDLTRAVDCSRETQPAREVFSENRIPTPALPRMDESQVPEPPMLQQRVFRQSGPLPTPSREGPTADLRHPKATEVEGTFKEVENFFFRPTNLYPPLLSLNETGLTGLFRATTADIQRKGGSWFRTGLQYQLYDQSFGVELERDRRIERVTVPFTYATVPVENMETSLQLRLTNEDGRRFPIPTETSWEVAGVEDVQIAGKFRFINNTSERLSAAFGLGLRVGIQKNVVTRVGSNGVDYETFVTVTKGVKNFALTMQGGLMFPNGEDHTNSGVPDIFYGNLGLEFRPSGKVDAGLELNYLDWDHAGQYWQGTLGFKYRVSRRWIMDFAVPFDLGNDLAIGTGFGAQASLQVQL